APPGRDPPPVLEAVKRRVEGALVDPQHVARELLDALGDAPPVHRLQRQGPQDQEVQRALEQVGPRLRHTGFAPPRAPPPSSEEGACVSPNEARPGGLPLALRQEDGPRSCRMSRGTVGGRGGTAVSRSRGSGPPAASRAAPCSR